MAARLTHAQKMEYGPYAWRLSKQALTSEQIARRITRKYGQHISEKAVDRLLAHERARNLERYAADRDAAAGEYIAEQRAMMADALGRLPSIAGPGAAQLHHVVIQCSRNIAEVYGIPAKALDITSGGESFVRHYIGVDIDQV